MTSILVMGSNTVDIYVSTQPAVMSFDKADEDERTMLAYELGDKYLASDLHVCVGGSGLNAATAFARTGLDTSYLGCLGDDMFGAKVLQHFDDENIDFKGSLGDRTGIGIILDSQADDRTILSHKGANNDLGIQDIPDDLSPDWFYTSTVMETTRQTMTALINSLDATTAVNMSSYLCEHGLKELHAVLNATDYLFVNRDEAEDLTGESELEAMFTGLDDVVRGTAIITDGSSGAYYEADTNLHHLASHASTVVETTGAGDAFNAGFVTAAASGASRHDAVKAGMIQAEHVLQHASTTADLLSHDELFNELNDDTRTPEVIR